jgi:hypothetical protein
MKKALIMLVLMAGVIAAMSFIDPKPPRFQNLKVLPKNTDKNQLDSVMDHFTAALGVKCNFCHVRLNDEQKNWDFASDANHHKEIARKMMKMTASLNKKYFDVKESKGWQTSLYVTCFTCHNGKPEPAVWPPAPPGKQ